MRHHYPTILHPLASLPREYYIVYIPSLPPKLAHVQKDGIAFTLGHAKFMRWSVIQNGAQYSDICASEDGVYTGVMGHGSREDKDVWKRDIFRWHSSLGITRGWTLWYTNRFHAKINWKLIWENVLKSSNQLVITLPLPAVITTHPESHVMFCFSPLQTFVYWVYIELIICGNLYHSSQHDLTDCLARLTINWGKADHHTNYHKTPSTIS